MAKERDQNHMDKFISDQVYIDWVTGFQIDSHQFLTHR
jgi:hypothetical protein